jgi:hypothetical protein
MMVERVAVAAIEDLEQVRLRPADDARGRPLQMLLMGLGPVGGLGGVPPPLAFVPSQNTLST